MQDVRNAPDPTGAGGRTSCPRLILWWGCLCQLRRIGRRFALALANGRDDPVGMGARGIGGGGAAGAPQDSRHERITAAPHHLDKHFIGIAILAYKLLREKSCLGLSMQTQELTAIFLGIRLYCSFMMEYDWHTILDFLTIFVPSLDENMCVGAAWVKWFVYGPGLRIIQRPATLD